MTTYDGIHPVTAGMAHLLAQQGVVNPLTGEPFSEALLLGIGGGLGAGYLLFVWGHLDSAIIVLGFRNRWNYTLDYLHNLAGRLGATLTLAEGARKKGAADLAAGLARGVPFMAWVDKAHLPYQHLPAALKGYLQHQVIVCGAEDDQILVADLAQGLFRVPAAAFAAARERITHDKHRLLFVTPPAQVEVAAALRAGIADHVEHLGGASETFALPVYPKWARLMTHPTDKKSWRTVFAERSGLYTTLCSLYESITEDGTEGSALRALYADFLAEAAELLHRPGLKEAAAAYQAAAQAWQRLAAAALPDSVPEFAATRALLQQRYTAYHTLDVAGTAAAMAQLGTLAAQCNREGFPLEAAATGELFVSLADQLRAVYAAEVQALAVLRGQAGAL
ncbi:MAG: DUF4872 domain-containing protein [Anaerolineae bacterium]|jgi:hypothetical protein|nr:DUF4872 domain-containing protein [Anaerolineae bacterium]